MSVKKTTGETYVTSYRIGKKDAAIITKKYGGLCAFVNMCVAKEVAASKKKSAAKKTK